MDEKQSTFHMQSTSEIPSKPQTQSTNRFQVPQSIRACKSAEKYRVQGRTIVICLDGTGDQFDDDNSNIVDIVRCLKKDAKSQDTYYQAGIGTYGNGGLSSGVTAMTDMAVGSGLGLHIRDAYRYIMHTYKEGDKICIFGFSRGAYTARCLAGMVHKVGLLPPRNTAQIPFAYKFYKDDTRRGWEQSAEFKRTFCIDVNVYFLGLFDSVASVGWIPRQLPLSSTPSNKSHYFRHAMALDEHRAKFKVCRFVGKDFKDIIDPKTGHPTVLSEQPASSPDHEQQEDRETKDVDTVKTPHPPKESEIEPADNSEEEPETEFERQMYHKLPFDTDVKEVWFLGAHADVGGGAVKNEERHKLSRIPLRWMIRQSFECDTGIIFEARALAELGLDVHTLWPKYKSLGVPDFEPTLEMLEHYNKGLPSLARRASKLVPIPKEGKGEGYYRVKALEEAHHMKNGEWLPEQIEDYFDCLAPAHDQLVEAQSWWILELWPIEYRIQKVESDEWESRVGVNMGMYRAAEDKNPIMHWTVRHLMHNKNYKLQVRFGKNAIWKVVD